MRERVAILLDEACAVPRAAGLRRPQIHECGDASNQIGPTANRGGPTKRRCGTQTIGDRSTTTRGRSKTILGRPTTVVCRPTTIIYRSPIGSCRSPNDVCRPGNGGSGSANRVLRPAKTRSGSTNRVCGPGNRDCRSTKDRFRPVFDRRGGTRSGVTRCGNSVLVNWQVGPRIAAAVLPRTPSLMSSEAKGGVSPATWSTLALNVGEPFRNGRDSGVSLARG